MNINELKKIIIDQQEELDEILKQNEIIERQVPIEKLKGFLRKPNILAILGIRRSGKSMLSAMLLQGEVFGHVNFDDERLAGCEASDLDLVLQALYELYGPDLEFIFLDEIQNVPGWELFVNRLRRTKKVILTGSNANLLSGELATHLTGRHLDFTLFPFSFTEYLNMKGIDHAEDGPDTFSTKTRSVLKTELEEFMNVGGFPERFSFGRPIVLRTYEDIIQKDILLRYGIRNRKTFSEIAKFVISHSSKELSQSRLKRLFDIRDVHTVKNYLDHLSSAYLTFTIDRFSYKLQSHSIAPKKTYCVDTGIINIVGFRFSENRGNLMENVVAVELRRRASYWNPETEVYFWKGNGDREVDFVLKQGTAIAQLIQVTYASSKVELRDRELISLEKASMELKCDDLLLITWDFEDILEMDGRKIVCKPLWKWLLDQG